MVSFIGRGNHRPAASYWQTLSHNVVSSTPRLSGIRTHNDRVRKVPYLNFWNFSDPIVEVNAVVRHFRQPWVLIQICFTWEEGLGYDLVTHPSSFMNISDMRETGYLFSSGYKYNKTITALCVGKHPDVLTLEGLSSLGQALLCRETSRFVNPRGVAFPLRLTHLDVSLHRGP